MAVAFSLQTVIVAMLVAFAFGGGWGLGDREQTFGSRTRETPVAQISLAEFSDQNLAPKSPESSTFLTGTLARSGAENVRPPAAPQEGAQRTASIAVPSSAPKPKPAVVLPPPAPAAVTVSAANTSQICSYTAAQSPSHQGARLNEIAWMGTVGSASDEWIELKNISNTPLNLSGWQMVDQGEQVRVVFVNEDAIPANGFFLLERTDDATVPGVLANKIYQGALGNMDEGLRLFNNQCILVDEALANPNWPAGDAGARKTMERNAADLNWHTSVAHGGTPRAENSAPIAPLAASGGGGGGTSGGGGGGGGSSTPPPPAMHTLSVLIAGSGLGTVASDPAGISCSPDCDEEYAGGTQVTLTATPDAGSAFESWNGACAGSVSCAVTVSSDISVTAVFATAQVSGSPAENGAQSLTLVSAPAAGADHIVISEVQITGGPGQTTNDFIELYNPTVNPYNLIGHRLVKRTATAVIDILIKSWTEDTFIPAHGFYLWASSNFVSIAVTPDVVSSDTIADNNGIALRLGASNTGAIIDSVAWGTAANGFGEGAILTAELEANGSYERKAWQNGSCISAQGSGASAGNGCDTNSNAFDFEVRVTSNPQNTQSSPEP